MSANEKRDAPASVLITRELLRTPVIQDLLRDSMRHDADAAPALTRALLEEDPQLALDLAAALPSRINAAGQAAAELAAALDRFPTALTREASVHWSAELDTQALGEQFGALLTAVWRHVWLDPESRAALLAAVARSADSAVDSLVVTLEQDPESLTDPLEQAAGALIDGLDLGKIRWAHQLGLEAAAEPLSRLTARVMGDPVLVANLVAALPPLANAQLRALADAVEALELPAEVLASALFNLLQAVDQEPLARLINRVALLITEAHRGNLILGRHEPRFLTVCGDLLQGLLPRLDGERLTGAAQALAEDLETALAAWEGLAQRRPELDPGRLAGALARAASPLWPRARAAAARVIPAHAGQLAGAMVGGFVDAVERDPELVGRTLAGALAGTEPERLARTVTRTLEQVGEVFVSRPELREAVTGSVIGAPQGLVMQTMSALGERLRQGPAKDHGPSRPSHPGPEPKPQKSAPRRLAARLLGKRR